MFVLTSFIWGNAGGGGHGRRQRLGAAREMGRAFPWGAKRKRHPSLKPQNGTRFPLGGRSGNCIPEFSLKAGYAFQMETQVESASQNIASERDAVSG